MELWHKKLAVIACLLGLSCVVTRANSETVDIRECPLDTIVFVDPGAGGSFTVKRVGTDYVYLCESGVLEKPVSSEECTGPYGNLVLEGDLTKYKDSKPKSILAIWYVQKAVPCCGWTILENNPSNTADVKWLASAEVPLLGNVPFAGIEPSESDTASFGNPKYAMICMLN